MVKTKKTKDEDEEVKEGVDAGSDESGEDNDVKDTGVVTKKSGVTKITFHLRNLNVASHVSTRVFDELTHGEDFVKIADEFAGSNASSILSRADE